MPEQLSRFLSDPTLAKLLEHPGQYTLKELLVTAVRAEQIELGVLADSVLKEQIPDMMHFGQHTEFMPLYCIV